MSYLDWKPAISAEKVFEKSVYFSDIEIEESDLFWSEVRSSEDGRKVIVKSNNGKETTITPPSYNIRSRVHEYGGKAFTINKNWIYFVNFNDQRIYKQDINNSEKIEALTPEKNSDGTLGKYMHLNVSPDGKWLVFVYEKEYEKKENKNFIGTIYLTSNKISEAIILAKGADFYTSPMFSFDGEKIAWKQWMHPFMPWDSTELMIGNFDNGKIKSLKKVAGGKTKAIGATVFGKNSTLYFTMDEAKKEENDYRNYFNIYRYSNGKTEALTKELGEFGSLKYIKTENKKQQESLLATFTVKGKTNLSNIEIDSRKLTNLKLRYSDFHDIEIGSGRDLFLIVGSPHEPQKIIKLEKGKDEKLVKFSRKLNINSLNIPTPKLIEFPTRDGKKAYGYLYLPKNDKYKAPKSEKPPVKVLLHGGPTGSTSTQFSMVRLFWTSQGYAIFDINYRGSTGYGRKYRDALLGKWGIIDAGDTRDGIKFLVKKNYISEDAIISGCSAGGYSVQRLLTLYPELFKAGASYFGIGNLITLRKLTHKFESRYLIGLIGKPLEEAPALYKERSPINHIDKLKAPMIIFQGAKDKVVHPENSREMARVIEKRNIYHEYYEYEDEGHGFRKKENVIDCLEKEAKFFKKILREKQRPLKNYKRSNL